jgi:cell division protein FtsI/penicillin-binding protein 2
LETKLAHIFSLLFHKNLLYSFIESIKPTGEGSIKILAKIGHGGLLFACLALFFICYAAFSQETTIPEIQKETIAMQQDSVLTKHIKTFLNRWHPPNAFILMMDANSGNILAWGQRENDENSKEPSFLQRDSFPAASLAKIVTTVAALENGSSSKSKIPKIGRNSTLYKRQIFPKENYSGGTITIEDAFAKSNNPAMGIIGMELGQNKMQNTAKKLGFANFNYPDSGYGLAESACGFTQQNILSPLQVANAIRKLIFIKPSEEFNDNTYEEIRNLFLKTVNEGTAKKDMRKSVYGYNRNSLDIGGKTGSLDGVFPTGRYDWFAGFAQSKTAPDKAIIIVVMQVHGKLRYQHSSIIAGLLINEWAKR